MKVKLSQIKINPDCDQKFTIREIEELVESMEINELMAPIVVTHDKFILSGYRQYEMAKFLGWEEIDVIIRTADQENKEYTVIPNYVTQRKKREDVLNDIQQLYQNYHKSQENSDEMPISKSNPNYPDESKQQESWYW